MNIKFNIGDKIFYADADPKKESPVKCGKLAQIRIFQSSILYYVYGIKRGFPIAEKTKEEAEIAFLKEKIMHLKQQLERAENNAGNEIAPIV
jgi:hypothetical protein